MACPSAAGSSSQRMKARATLASPSTSPGEISHLPRGLKPGGWRAIGLDAEGLDLAAGGRAARAQFAT